MSDHLPECPTWAEYEHLCICDRLRACEQRVLDAAWEAVWEAAGPGADAFSQLVLARTLAAIDALRVQPAERREDNLRGES